MSGTTPPTTSQNWLEQQQTEYTALKQAVDTDNTNLQADPTNVALQQQLQEDLMIYNNFVETISAELSSKKDLFSFITQKM